MTPKPETLFYSTDRLELIGTELSRTTLGREVRMGWFAEFADEGMVGSFELTYALRSPQILMANLALRPLWEGDPLDDEIMRAIPNLPVPRGLHTLRRLGSIPTVTSERRAA